MKRGYYEGRYNLLMRSSMKIWLTARRRCLVCELESTVEEQEESPIDWAPLSPGVTLRQNGSRCSHGGAHQRNGICSRRSWGGVVA